ncbi:MAG TPA: DUF202 domain-containing protein [Chitinispirillaceae bacterium]|jgi:putative membrane protein|nr:DUF202 domain-containing protein [Chitinispirillaceae bacterium]
MGDLIPSALQSPSKSIPLEVKMLKNGIVHSKLPNRRVHMANERTYLAWVRTAIGIIAFGFAIERFSFIDVQQSAHWAALLLVAFGVIIQVFAFIRYRTIEKSLDEGRYKSNLFLTASLTFFVIVMGIFLFVFLLINF